MPFRLKRDEFFTKQETIDRVLIRYYTIADNKSLMG